MNKEPLFAAKCIFRHFQLEPIGEKKYVYEERIVLIHANSMDEAIIKAEIEAKEYAGDMADAEYLGYINVFNLVDYILTKGSELYSEIRSSDLDREDYINSFYDTGYEHCGNAD